MSLYFSICCFTICFTPALMLAKRVVVSDPLRIILFVLGAFFWLLSLLLTSLVWTATGDSLFLVPVYFSALFQELARALYCALLYKAQGGLARLATDGVDVSGVRLMYSSRHVLAIVCGLGMGVMAALFMVTNILADYADDGVVGLPAAIAENSTAMPYTKAYFPLYYSLSCALLTMFNSVWTVTLWDALHKCFHKLGGLWFLLSIALTHLSHILNTTMSFWLFDQPLLILSYQLLLLLATTTHAVVLIKNIGLTEIRDFFTRRAHTE